jgi:predicted small lipoprotein YifL
MRAATRRAAHHAVRRTAPRGGLVLISAMIALVVAGGTLSACGQKGQLYLPSQKKSKVPPNQQPQGNPPQDSQPPGTTPPSSTAPAAS